MGNVLFVTCCDMFDIPSSDFASSSSAVESSEMKAARPCHINRSTTTRRARSRTTGTSKCAICSKKERFTLILQSRSKNHGFFSQRFRLDRLLTNMYSEYPKTKSPKSKLRQNRNIFFKKHTFWMIYSVRNPN